MNQVVRQKEMQPIAPGWYYAARKGYVIPQPVRVYATMLAMLFVNDGERFGQSPSEYDWFGPVVRCITPEIEFNEAD